MGIQITFPQPLSFSSRSIINNKLFWSRESTVNPRPSTFVPFAFDLSNQSTWFQINCHIISKDMERIWIEGLESQPEIISTVFTNSILEIFKRTTTVYSRSFKQFENCPNVPLEDLFIHQSL